MKNTVRIYGRDFAETGITANFTRLEYTKDFRHAGAAEMVLPSDGTAALLVPDGYIRVPDGEMYRIVSVEKDQESGETTVKCKGLLSLLSGTVIPEEYTLTGSASALMYALARKSVGNLPLSLTLGGTVECPSVRISSGRSYLYDDLVSLCYLGNIGMSLEVSGGKLLFSVLSPRDRTAGSGDPVLVSPRMGTAEPERLVWDFDSYRNVAVVSGTEMESGGRYTVIVRSDSLDLGRFPDGEFYDRQTLVNFTAPVRPYMFENSEGLLELNESAYTEAMKAAGAAVLGRTRPRITLYGAVDEVSAAISPGDRVTVADGDTGLSGTATAETVTVSYTGSGKTVRAELTADLAPELLG